MCSYSIELFCWSASIYHWLVTITSHCFISIYPHSKTMYPNNKGLFQDNALCIRSKLFRNNIRGILETFDKWCGPSDSLDMSPSENLCDVVKRSICIQDPAPTNIRELWTATEREYISESLPSCLNHLWNWCYTELSHFDGLKVFLYVLIACLTAW